MRKLYFIALCTLMSLSMACKKDDKITQLPDASVSFELPAGSDVVEMPVALDKDITTTIELKAALLGTTSSSDHLVTFAIDTTKIADYRAKYGAALLPRVTSYLFYKPTATIAAGASVSEPAQLNIGQQTQFIEYSTYVLPVVIKSVDGKVEGPATTRVVYYVFKTGKPLNINKVGWAIQGFSSVFNAFAATNLIDNSATTYWTSNIVQTFPQWVVINFNRDIIFTGLSYGVPALLSYPALGGYPTSIRIETSMNGTTWTDKGLFAGNIVANKQTIDLGLTTARYLRFTVLAGVKYANTYDAIFINDISLLP
jgi:hypothetical protein